MIDLLYQITHDIDWFCVINHVPIHIASNGGRIPDFYFNRRMLFRVQNFVEQLPMIGDAEPIDSDVVHQEYSRGLVKNSESQREDYYRSFMEMACRGFYSYDRIDIGEGRSRYILVAKPKIPLNELFGMEIFTHMPSIRMQNFNENLLYIDDLVELMNRNENR